MKSKVYMHTIKLLVSTCIFVTDRGGATGLRKVEVKKDDESNDDGNSKGPFTDPAAQEVLHKAKSNSKLT